MRCSQLQNRRYDWKATVIHYTTSRMVAGSRSDEVIVIHLPNPYGRTTPWGLRSLKQKPVLQTEIKIFWGVERGRCMGLTTAPSSVSRLSIQCGILNIPQPYRTPLFVTEKAFFFICSWSSYLLLNIPTNLHGLLPGQLCFLYVDDIRTSQESHLRVSMVCYENIITFYLLMMFDLTGNTYEPPWSLTGIALIFNI
jgi:hypothetical protein